MKLIGKIQHPNLVRLIGYCETKRNWILVYEYMPNGSLKDHLSVKSNTPLSWDRRLKIARDAATGLLHLHSGLHQRIIFGNFKPSNILLDSHMNAKLSDFGFSNESPQEGGTNVSTSVVGYAAPEYVKSGHLTSKIDIWSFGVFLEELITGGRPLTQENSEKNPECLTWVCCYAGARKSIDPRLEGEYSENSMRMVASVANKCLANDPELRPGMTEVLKLLKEAIALETKKNQLLKSKCWPDLATHVC
uniref:serine/threonine-protein kinase PCRK1-like n=1 Tax=Erigeron canadensis TaxID=72917 RepID=UPI001CB971C2|nr:serine/threonine-protein kinase PCRK1-like [Erigeron canadensis]